MEPHMVNHANRHERAVAYLNRQVKYSRKRLLTGVIIVLYIVIKFLT
jgi:hypothetical protein